MRGAVEVLVNVTTERRGSLRVFKQGDTYTIEVNRSPTQETSQPDEVISALGHYILSLNPPRQE